MSWGFHRPTQRCRPARTRGQLIVYCCSGEEVDTWRLRESGIFPSTGLIGGQGPSYLLGNATVLGTLRQLVLPLPTVPKPQAEVIKMAGHYGDSLEVGGTGPGQGNQVVVKGRSQEEGHGEGGHLRTLGHSHHMQMALSSLDRLSSGPADNMPDHATRPFSGRDRTERVESPPHNALLGTRKNELSGAAPLYSGQMSNQCLGIPTPGSGSDQPRDPEGQDMAPHCVQSTEGNK